MSSLKLWAVPPLAQVMVLSQLEILHSAVAIFLQVKDLWHSWIALFSFTPTTSITMEVVALCRMTGGSEGFEAFPRTHHEGSVTFHSLADTSKLPRDL
jgi:hypothetical protein